MCAYSIGNKGGNCTRKEVSGDVCFPMSYGNKYNNVLTLINMNITLIIS